MVKSLWARLRPYLIRDRARLEQMERELLELPVEAWHSMGGDVVRKERGRWPQRILLVLAASLLALGILVGETLFAQTCDALALAEPTLVTISFAPHPLGSVLPYPTGRPTPTASPTPKPTPKPTPRPTPAPPILGYPLATRGTLTCRFSSYHPAIDLAAPAGTRWLAAMSGTIVWAGWKNDGGGYVVDISTGVPPTDGYPGRTGWFISYNHGLPGIPVHVGQKVVRGQWIGNVGCSGHCTGPHLHFMVAHYGIWRDPWPLL